MREAWRRWSRQGRYLALAALLHVAVGGTLYLAALGLQSVQPKPVGVVMVSLLPAPEKKPAVPSKPAPPARREAAQAPAAKADITLPAAQQAQAGEAAQTPAASSPAPEAAAAPVSAEAPAPSGMELQKMLDARERWMLRMLAELQKNKRYPPDAERSRQEDRVTLRLKIERNGHVLLREVASSQGYELLDHEALELVDRSAPLPPLPPEMREASFEFLVPVDFHIGARGW